MRLKKLLAAVAASSLIATPALANGASSLSVAKAVNAKAATSAKKSNKLSGTTIAVAVLATAAIVGGIIAITDDSDDSDSN